MTQEIIFSLEADTLQMVYAMIVVMAIAYVFGNWGKP